MSVDTQAIFEQVREALPDAGVSYRENPGASAQHSILLEPESALDVFRYLRDTPGLEFDLLSCVSGVDWPDAALADAVAAPGDDAQAGEGGFFEVVYFLYSTNRRVGPLVLRARTRDRGENAEVVSVVSVYRSAEFQEREIFDLYGVKFSGHPDLRRILMWDEFEDYPMRKDYVEPDDYEYEPTPHDAVLEKAKKHYS